MSIRTKLIFLFSTCAALVGGLGTFSFFLLRELRPHLTGSQLKLADQISDGLIYGLPTACFLVVATGMVMGVAIARRAKSLQVNFLRAEPIANVQSGDEFDQLAASINDLAVAAKTLNEKQVSEQQLLAAKRYADNIVCSISDILIVTDSDQCIVTANRAACDLLEYTELELVGRRLETLFKQQSYAMSVPIVHLLKERSANDLEMTYVSRSGRLIEALVSVSIMRDPVSRPMGTITVGKDITARKQMERELLEAKIAAEAASRAKSAFVANMSHEIRTPMTAILGYADLLAHPDQSSEERGKCIETLRRNGQHLLSIINDILDISKIEAGRMSVERIACATQHAISDVCTLMSLRARDKGLTFDVEFATAIPSVIESDPTRLRQILMNLLGNAIKFTNKGGIRLVVSYIEAQKNVAAKLKFDVIDTGVGMTGDQIKSLFRAFVQADASTTRRFGGTGLGLAISKRLAELLGGDVVVRSLPDKGSTFSLTVETGRIAGSEMIGNAQTVLGPAQKENRWKQSVQLSGHVLVAEDGLDNRVLITFYLKHIGLDVTVVENGKLALDAALDAWRNHKPFDVILMDMQMPELDGYGAATALRAAGYPGPIIANTAHAMEGDRDKCLAAGCDDVANKPIDFNKLLALLHQYIKTTAAAQPAGQKALPVTPKCSEPTSREGTSTESLLAKPNFARLVDRFVSGLQDRVDQIGKAVEAGNQARLKVLTHQLKGAAGGYGFGAISQAATDLENATEQDVNSIRQSLNELAKLCADVRAKYNPSRRQACENLVVTPVTFPQRKGYG